MIFSAVAYFWIWVF